MLLYTCAILFVVTAAGIAGATSLRVAPVVPTSHQGGIDEQPAHGPAAYRHALRAHLLSSSSTTTAPAPVPAPAPAPPPASPKQKWRLSVGCHHWGPGCWVPGFQGTDSSPTVGPDGYVVIASYNSNVYSVHADTGHVRWTAPGGGESSPFLTRDNKVLIPSYSSLQKLDGATGKKEWSWAPTTWDGSIASAGAIDDDLGLVFAGALDDNMYAVDLATGKTRWTYASGGEIWSSLGSLNLASKGLVCFGVGGSAIPSSDCHAAVHCVRKADGKRAWVGRTGKQIQSRPAFGNRTNAVFVGDYDNCVYAFDADAGQPLWKTCTKGRVESSPAVFSDDAAGREIVAVGSGDGFLYGFDGATGRELWKTRCNSAVGVAGGGVLSSPWIHAPSATAFVGGGGISAVNVRTGALQWHFAPAGGDAGAQFGASPYVTADGSTLYEGGEDGYLYALDLTAVKTEQQKQADEQGSRGSRPSAAPLRGGRPRPTVAAVM